jgi:hypothetical protein
LKEIELTKGKVAFVDDDDFEKLTKVSWYYNTSGYACNKGGLSDKVVYMHRFIMNCPDDMIVDHIDGNKLNNQKENLRIVTYSQNHMNRKVKRKGCSSKYKGVSLDKRCGKWRAYIKKDGKYIHIGNFDNEIDAAKAYDEKALELFGEYASLNFPV